MITFIHTGDLHLGLQFKKTAFYKAIGNNRRIELWQTFERIVRHTIDNNIDFLFIAGDLFEAEFFTIGDIKRVRDILSRAEKQKILISTGNHDALSRKSFYNQVEWPDNVHIFSSQGISKREYKNLNTVVYGYSWDYFENEGDVIEEIEYLDKSKNNILIVHGDVFNKESPYLPLSVERLENFGFDYIALGHIHKPQLISDKIAYCGSPEPLHFGETGTHGIIKGQISKEQTKIELLPFSLRMFKDLKLDVNEYMSFVDIMDKVKEMQNNDKTNFFRITISGILNRDININGLKENLKNEFYYLELIDNTELDYDLDAMEDENRDNIIGMFINKMKDYDLEDKVYKDALHLGLKSLMEGRLN